MDEVAQVTAYVGAKKVGDDTAYERISTVDEDISELDVLFDECRAELVLFFKRYLVTEGMNDDKYELCVEAPESFNEALVPGMNIALFNYYVHGILGRWFELTDKERSDAEYLKAANYLDGVKKNAFGNTCFTRKISVL